MRCQARESSSCYAPCRPPADGQVGAAIEPIEHEYFFAASLNDAALEATLFRRAAPLHAPPDRPTLQGTVTDRLRILSLKPRKLRQQSLEYSQVDQKKRDAAADEYQTLAQTLR